MKKEANYMKKAWPCELKTVIIVFLFVAAASCFYQFITSFYSLSASFHVSVLRGVALSAFLGKYSSYDGDSPVLDEIVPAAPSPVPDLDYKSDYEFGDVAAEELHVTANNSKGFKEGDDGKREDQAVGEAPQLLLPQTQVSPADAVAPPALTIRADSPPSPPPSPPPPPPPPPPPKSLLSPAKREFMKRKEELLQAKLEIERGVSIVVDDPDLYAPLFLNISKFKKSYDLMEKIFRVYMYQEGRKPIFHSPPLKGIYAAEGWFMKTMMENKRFVVRNPDKAHMFYLPYSVHQLVESMYVPGSHTMAPLSLFLKNYVNLIAAKHPYWNRTHGGDHFFVSCHDWGPYTTSAHQELKKNAVKVLCNADVSEGYFVTGRDVSLPEIYMRNAKLSNKNLGGKPVSARSILAFFAGNMHGSVRPILLKYWKNRDDDMKIYEHIPVHVAKSMSYSKHMKASKYCICPKGYEVNSPRIVEAIYYECVPVIISDNFVPPLNEVLDWNAFSVTVTEKDIPNLKDILLSIPEKRYLSMQYRVKRLQRHFLFHKKPVKYDLFHMILHSVWLNNLNQIKT